LQGGDFSRSELDAISTDHPILIWYINLHDACVNSEAFKIAGIGEDVGELPGGGHFGRGPDGKLNGLVYEESAMLKFAVHFLGKITPEVAAKAVTDYAQHVASVAIRCCTSPARSARTGLGVHQTLEYARLPHQRQRDV